MVIVVFGLLSIQCDYIKNYYLDSIINKAKTVSGAVWYPTQCKIDAKSPDL